MPTRWFLSILKTCVMSHFHLLTLQRKIVKETASMDIGKGFSCKSTFLATQLFSYVSAYKMLKAIKNFDLLTIGFDKLLQIFQSLPGPIIQKCLHNFQVFFPIYTIIYKGIIIYIIYTIIYIKYNIYMFTNDIYNSARKLFYWQYC